MQYHFALEEFYEIGDFDETKSEIDNQNAYINYKKQKRFTAKINKLRDEKDLATVHESLNEFESPNTRMDMAMAHSMDTNSLIKPQAVKVQSLMDPRGSDPGKPVNIRNSARKKSSGSKNNSIIDEEDNTNEYYSMDSNKRPNKPKP